MQINQIYSVDQETGLVISIHSKVDGSTNTTYAFDYWTEAEVFDMSMRPMQWYHQYYVNGDEKRRQLSFVVVGVLGTLVIVLTCCILYCLKECCWRLISPFTKKTTVEPVPIMLTTEADL